MQAIWDLITDVLLGSYIVYWCTPTELYQYLMGHHVSEVGNLTQKTHINCV